jgi:hypothetical protein
MPREIQDGFIKFAEELQDESDGYFYHPQWGKKISASRRGRDLMWAKGLINKFGGKAKYLLPEERIAKSKSEAEEKSSDAPVIDERFTSKEKYLESLV